MITKTLKIALVATALTGSASAQGFDWSQLGVTVPKAGAPIMCDHAASHAWFNQFHCPAMAEAMWNADPSMIAQMSRAEKFVYVTNWVTAVHDPAIVWKVDSSVYASLDPRLPMHVRFLIANNPDVLGGIAGEGIGIWGEAFKRMLDVRRHAVDTGTMNPMGELSAFLGGAANAPKPVTLTSEIAKHDVMVWIGLAQQDPSAAIQLYQGMRQLALSF
ncbi:hypothetical protein [Dinoroseobacter sp. S76]|uniref:hypothetical protein n=1 Tax=Dinoroseobacter sp. S76 TaxID=3415124 RepID=UPI003C7AB908